MTTPIELLTSEVLNLPRHERSKMLEQLLHSLDEEDQWQREWEQSWARECSRREADVRQGLTTLLSGNVVMATLKAKHGI